MRDSGEASPRRTADTRREPPTRTARTSAAPNHNAGRRQPSHPGLCAVLPSAIRLPSPSAVVQRVEADCERNREPAVEPPLLVAREVEDVAVAQLELSIESPDGAVVDEIGRAS